MSAPAPPSSPKPSWSEVIRAVAPYMNIGWAFVVAIGLGILLGRWIDSHWHTEPWFFIIGAFLGIAVGFYQFFLVVLRK